MAGLQAKCAKAKATSGGALVRTRLHPKVRALFSMLKTISPHLALLTVHELMTAWNLEVNGALVGFTCCRFRDSGRALGIMQDCSL